MNLINTHSHVYTESFDVDRDSVIKHAINQNVTKILLPDIDASHRESIIALSQTYPDVCLPMFGIHPTSINADYLQEIEQLEIALKQHSVIAIGEIGIDLYWDSTFYKEQVAAFLYQMNLAKIYTLPVVIHVRNAFDEIFEAIASIGDSSFNGVFHCFSGNLEQAHKVIDLGFMLGIGGVVTYKKSGLDEIVREIPLEHIVLETDDPWLPPVPYRGKRNEPSYLQLIAQKVAEIKGISVEDVAEITTKNAKKLFSI